MGLDLICGETSQRFGAYSTVQRHRMGWIKAEIFFFQKRGTYSRDVLKTLRGVIEKDRILYSTFDQCKGYFSQGLQCFVNHSDCDGVWSPDQCQEMLGSLEKISKLLEQTEECRDYFDEEGRYFLQDLFVLSVENDENIEFF